MNFVACGSKEMYASHLPTWNKPNQPSLLLQSVLNKNPLRAPPPNTTTTYGNVLQIIFYISLIVFILFLVLVFVHFTITPVFSFNPNDNGFIYIPTVSDSQTDFTSSPAPSDISAKFTDIPAYSYTIGMDLYLSGSFYISPAPRVLLYRGKTSLVTASSPGMGPSSDTAAQTLGLPSPVDSNTPITKPECPTTGTSVSASTVIGSTAASGTGSDMGTGTGTGTGTGSGTGIVSSAATGTGIVSSAATTSSKMTAVSDSTVILKHFPDTNIIVWLDSMKNDLNVIVITSSDGTAAKAEIQTMDPIENIPMKEVIRVTVTFTQKFVEVYINGTLEKTMTLYNPPLPVSDSSMFYPPISNVMPSAFLGNLTFWPRVLTVREIASNGGPIASDSFFSKSAL